MSQALPTTSFALLGLLTFGDDLTGYELKQRADRTLRFYWVSPAMSQVYTELGRLAGLGLVKATGDKDGRTSRYRITRRGRERLRTWLSETPAEFQTLKHPVALRLLIGHLVGAEHTVAMLDRHLAVLAQRRQELERVRESLVGRDGLDQPFGYPALVADWGLEYFDAERDTIHRLRERLGEQTQ